MVWNFMPEKIGIFRQLSKEHGYGSPAEYFPILRAVPLHRFARSSLLPADVNAYTEPDQAD
jgi:hypothetical protein